MSQKEKAVLDGGSTQGGSVGGTKPIEKTPVKKRKKTPTTKPADYKKHEDLAKVILDRRGINYFEWLDKQHKDIILDFTVSNIDEIQNLVREED